MGIKVNFILNFVFFLGIICSYAQDRIIVPPLNSGIYGDELVRVIEAKEGGAVIRFKSNVFGSTLWNKDSMINELIHRFELDSNSTNRELIMAVSSFIKNEQVFSHIEGYGSINLSPSCIEDKGVSFTSLPHRPSALCSDFSSFFSQLIGILNQRFNQSIRTRIVALNGHVVNEAFDSKTRKWVYVDSDPQTGLMLISKDKVLFSIRDVKKNPQLILDCLEEEKQRFSAYDSLRLHEKANELYNIIKSTNRPVYSKVKTSLDNFDFYYRLDAKQDLTWSYMVEGVFVNKNQCEQELYSLFQAGANAPSHEFRLAMRAYANCQQISPITFANSLKNQTLSFSDSTFFGKNELRENTFSTTIYDENEVYKTYLPHVVKCIEYGEVLIDHENLKEGFNLSLYNFGSQVIKEEVSCESFYTLNNGFQPQKELTKISFYSNDRLNFEVNKNFEIVILEGGIYVDHYVNGRLIWSSREKN